jgi:hypothetical protein
MHPKRDPLNRPNEERNAIPLPYTRRSHFEHPAATCLQRRQRLCRHHGRARRSVRGQGAGDETMRRTSAHRTVHPGAPSSGAGGAHLCPDRAECDACCLRAGGIEPSVRLSSLPRRISGTEANFSSPALYADRFGVLRRPSWPRSRHRRSHPAVGTASGRHECAERNDHPPASRPSRAGPITRSWRGSSAGRSAACG